MPIDAHMHNQGGEKSGKNKNLFDGTTDAPATVDASVSLCGTDSLAFLELMPGEGSCSL